MIENSLEPGSVGTPRRKFLKGSAVLLGGSFFQAAAPFSINTLGYNKDPLKIALVGCGSRGAGAVVNALSTQGNVILVAMADLFRDKLDQTYELLTRMDRVKAAIQVPEKNKFIGFDGYEKALALADVVLLVTPSAFRPLHFEAAVQAGKHVFMEKPLASDAPGIRQVLATGALAAKKNLKVLVGLQNRYDPAFIEFVKRIKAGVIGDIISASDYYLIGPITRVPRKGGQSELEYQLRNWRYFNWLWAGSPASLQIHNTDVVNWVKGGYPVRAQGFGGRASLKGPEFGDIYDHFFIEYEYADGTKLNSQIRSISGTWNKGGSYFLGTKGSGSVQNGIKDASGNSLWKNRNQDAENAYQLEHDQFFAAIRNNTPFNDTEWGAKSTMTTLLGRMAAHSGKMVEWEEALHSDLTLLPSSFHWDAEPPTKPGLDGTYPIPIPGLSNIL